MSSSANSTMPNSPVDTPFTSAFNSAASSRRSSFCLNSTPEEKSDVPEKSIAPESKPAPAPAPPKPSFNLKIGEDDSMMQKYPKPEGEIDVAEALNRTPRQWTLGYWLKHGRDARVPNQGTTEEKKAKMEAIKAELRKAQSDMKRPKA